MKELAKIAAAMALCVIILIAGAMVFRTRNLIIQPATSNPSIQPDSTPHDQWNSNSVADKMDGSVTRMLSVSADNGSELSIRCHGHYLDAVVDVGEVIDSHDDLVQLRTRLDGFKAGHESWFVLKDLKGFGIEGNQAHQLLSDLADSKRLMIEYPTYLGPDKVATFDVSGLKRHLSEMSACVQPSKLRSSTSHNRPYHPSVGVRCTSSVTANCYDDQNIFHPLSKDAH